MRRYWSLPLLLLASLGACTAPWHHLVHYSAEPMPPSLDVEAGVYRAILQAYEDTAGITYVIADTGGVFTDSSVAGATIGPTVHIPGHWADTVKREVRAAMQDPGFEKPARTGSIELALATLPPNRFAATTLNETVPPDARRIVVSAAGFNHDSTIAVVRTTFSHESFGVGRTLLLARRPGMEWDTWYQFLEWIT